MKIAEMLSPDSVVTKLAAGGKDEAIAQLLAAMARARSFERDVALRDLTAREQSGSTLMLLADWIAVPHAMTEACKQFMLAVGAAPEGVPWGSSGNRAKLVFLMLGPPQTQALYLRVLSRIARLCNQREFCEAMLTAQTPPELLSRLATAEGTLGSLADGDGLPRFCVLGAGHGGMAMAAHLSLTGCKVNLYNRHAERLLPVQERGGIDVTGEVQGFARLNAATTDVREAIEGADILMIVVPATAHREMAEAIAPHVKDGQIIVLNPGRTGGALEVAKILRDLNPAAQPFVAEAQTLLYASRVTNPGQVHIFSIKNSVPLATLPAYQIPDVMPLIRKALPQFVPGDNVLTTSLDNIGAVFHPAITVLNAARIEDTHGAFEYYVQGVTPAVSLVLEAIDKERVAVAGALGIRAHTAREWLYLAYNAAGKTLLDAMRANPGYRGIQAPARTETRYITEDVPCSLVPIASIGEMLHVPTPTIRTIIHLASLLHGTDYWAAGRTVDRLGIRGKSVKDIRFLVVGAEGATATPAGQSAAGR